jgi:hypothetical protein
MKRKLTLLAALAVSFTAAAVYCGQLRVKSGGATVQGFFHYESGTEMADDIRTCECWYIDDTPRTLRCYAKWKDRYGVWYDKVGTPFTLTNTTSAQVISPGFYPCDGVYAIQTYIMEGTITRAVSNWY